MVGLAQRLTVELPGSICSGNFEIQAGQRTANPPAERAERPLQVGHNSAAGIDLTGGRNLFVDTSQVSILRAR